MLDPTQLRHWQQDGDLALPGFKPAGELAAVKARAHAIVEAFEPSPDSSRFSTRDRSLLADAALLASADRVESFFMPIRLLARHACRVSPRRGETRQSKQTTEPKSRPKNVQTITRLCRPYRGLGLDAPNWQATG